MCALTKACQFTTVPAPEGYWVDARGVLTPVSLIKPADQDRDALVGELVELAITVSDALREFKSRAVGDIQAFVDLSAEKYGAKTGGAKGNLSLFSYDGRFKVQCQAAEKIQFDERLQAAKRLIDECLTEWTDGARPEIHALISEAFASDSEGNIKTGRILALRRLEIDDDRWRNAMRAIGESVQVIGTKTYIRIYERIGDSNEYRPIPLDIAGV